MVKKRDTKPKANEPSTAPHLSPALLKEWTRHTAANSKAETEKDKIAEMAGEVALEETAKLPHQDAKSKDLSSDGRQPAADELATPENDEAVDDILLDEGNEQMHEQDDIADISGPQPKPPKQKKGFWRTVGHFFVAWWRNGWARWLTFFAVLIIATTLGAIPKTRYAILNSCGVRASVSLTVLDSDTRLPLKNVTVVADGQEAVTSMSGSARIQHVRLGPQKLQVKRFGFAPVSKNIIVGWGSNPLDQFFIKPVGAQYKLTVLDYVSGLPIKNAEADSGLAAAVSDNKGVITLTMDINTVTADLTVQAKGYRVEKLHVELNKSASGRLELVPAAKAVFVDDQGGSYDLVAAELDGKNRQVLLRGTATQNSTIALAPDPTNNRVAMVSTRDNVRNSDGFLLSTLSVVGIGDGGAQTVAHAERIKLIDWIGTKLIFEETAAGPSASDSQRYKIVAYDYTNNSQIQLATANQFNALLSVQGQIYYAPSSTDPTIQATLMRVKPDGTGRQTVLDQEAWTGFRANFNTINIQTSSGWYAVTPSGSPQKITAPTTFQNRQYASSGAYNIWFDLQRPGTMLNYNKETNKDKTVHSQTGSNYPVYWLNDQTLIYRLSTDEEVADYAVNVTNGHTKKVAHVFGTAGLGR